MSFPGSILFWPKWYLRDELQVRYIFNMTERGGLSVGVGEEALEKPLSTRVRLRGPAAWHLAGLFLILSYQKGQKAEKGKASSEQIIFIYRFHKSQKVNVEAINIPGLFLVITCSNYNLVKIFVKGEKMCNSFISHVCFFGRKSNYYFATRAYKKNPSKIHVNKSMQNNK